MTSHNRSRSFGKEGSSLKKEKLRKQIERIQQKIDDVKSKESKRNEKLLAWGPLAGGILGPVLTVLLTFIVAECSGLLEVEKRDREISLKTIDYENKKLSDKFEQLKKDTTLLYERKDSLSKRLQSTLIQVDSAKSEGMVLKAKMNVAKSMLAILQKDRRVTYILLENERKVQKKLLIENDSLNKQNKGLVQKLDNTDCYTAAYKFFQEIGFGTEPMVDSPQYFKLSGFKMSSKNIADLDLTNLTHYAFLQKIGDFEIRTVPGGPGGKYNISYLYLRDKKGNGVPMGGAGNNAIIINRHYESLWNCYRRLSKDQRLKLLLTIRRDGYSVF